MTPQEIVHELDKHIVGQQAAKRAVAIALRNRWRRAQVDESLRHEITPKNILMIGPTGVGKTEIARRLARLADAPFIKVEATKFTEVGYVGRDVDTIIRDLAEVAIKQGREAEMRRMRHRASDAAEERVLDALLPPARDIGFEADESQRIERSDRNSSTRQKFRKKLREGELDDKEIEIQVADTGTGSFEIPGMPGGSASVINLSDMLGKAFGGRTKSRRMSVKTSHELLLAEESDKLLDQDQIVQEAIESVENNGIVFLDEIDKICARAERQGADVSREGVQRDLLPLIEGTTVSTKHGPVKTDHILFIASGAFHIAKPSDLLPELQGRLPIRVELKALNREDLERILTEPEASLIKQYRALLQTEGVTLDFTAEGIATIAQIAAETNASIENIGARRLQTVMERLLDDVSYLAPDRSGETVVVDKAYVDKHVGMLAKNADLSKFIL